MNYPKHKRMKSILILSFCFCFFFFLFLFFFFFLLCVCVCVCKTMCFYLKWGIKKKNIYKTKYKNSTQENNTWNNEFWLNKNWLINFFFLETQRMTQHFHLPLQLCYVILWLVNNWHLNSYENIVTTTRCFNIFTREMLCS